MLKKAAKLAEEFHTLGGWTLVGLGIGVGVEGGKRIADSICRLFTKKNDKKEEA